MTDYLTPGLLDAIENKSLAEREHRKLNWLERAKYDFEVMKFRDALRRSEEQALEAHIRDRKQREHKFISLRKIMMCQRHQTWPEIVQDFRRKYAAIPKDDKDAQLDFILSLYSDYYFLATLIGNITNRSAKAVRLLLEEWSFENEKLKG